MDDSEHRFEGQLSEEYALIAPAYPDFEQFQRRMVEAVRNYLADHSRRERRVLEIGTGNGFTTRLLMDA